MKVVLSILLLDDHIETAEQSLRDAVQRLCSKQELGAGSTADPWHIAISQDLDFEVSYETIYERQEATEVLCCADELTRFQLILLDLMWSNDPRDRFGLELLHKMHEQKVPHPLLAIYTVYEAAPEIILPAVAWGARAVIKKDEPNHLCNLLLAAADHARLTSLEGKFTNIITEAEPAFETVSEAMKACLIDAAAYAPRNMPILIYGAPGTGKNLLARAIHRASPRAASPFESLDCGNLKHNDTLVADALFGHERGAFTGAENSRPGLFELAQKGTLFIDELQALSPEVQDRLLAVLQERTFRRIGGTRTQEFLGRVISATSEDPQKLVEQGLLRQPLYDRLACGLVRVPSLNERVEDIPRLAALRLESLCREEGRPAVTLTHEAIAKLQNHDWRPNVRGLHSVLERSLAHLKGDVMDFADLRMDPPLGQTDAAKIVSSSIKLEKLMKLTPPRQNSSQRQIFMLLVNNYPSWVPYRALHEGLGLPEMDHTTAGELLPVKIRYLKTRLESDGFTIENDNSSPSKGYRLKEIP